MQRTENQKLKLLYLMDYLTKNTDPEHPATTAELIDYLADEGITAERKAVYADIEALRSFGLEIESSGGGRSHGWYLAERTFQLAELKLLVDAVQSSRFITRKKTEELIRKIETLASASEAKTLQRQVYVSNRIKTMNESIYYNVDEIHSGISENRKIRFRYFEYTVKKERRLRREGAWYVVSPYALCWDDENYYLIAYESESGLIKHFRVDKMLEISVLPEARDGQERVKELDLGEYAGRVFGMYGGEEAEVTLRFKNRLVGAVIDRFGRDVMLIPDGEEHFTVSVRVAVSPQFFAWLLGFGEEAKLISPETVTDGLREYLRRTAAQY